MASRKLMILVSLSVIFAALIAACGPGGGGSTPPGGQTINVEGSEFSFTPVAITAKPGEAIKVNFKNTGTVEHTFVIKDLNFKLTAQPGATVSGVFTAPNASGTHAINCDIAGHTEAGMLGTLTVVAAAN